MKKVFTVLLSIVLLLSLVACQTPTPEIESNTLIMQPDYYYSFPANWDFPHNVVASAKHLDWKAEDGRTTLQITWNNIGENDVFFGASYFIERLEGEEWVSCAVRDDLSFIAIAYELPAGQEREETYDLTERYDISSPGIYRFRSEYYTQSDTDDSARCDVFARFYIKNKDGALTSEHTDIGTLDSFSFSLTWGVNGTSSYDSCTGKLIKCTIESAPEDYITTYHLSDAEKQQIYNLIASLDIMSYPDQYDPHNGESVFEPAPHLVLSVKTNTIDKRIITSGIDSYYQAENSNGQNFLNVCREIIDILMATEEWNALPICKIIIE